MNFPHQWPTQDTDDTGPATARVDPIAVRVLLIPLHLVQAVEFSSLVQLYLC